jgi:hypothetical protein
MHFTSTYNDWTGNERRGPVKRAHNSHCERRRSQNLNLPIHNWGKHAHGQKILLVETRILYKVLRNHLCAFEFKVNAILLIQVLKCTKLKLTRIVMKYMAWMELRFWFMFLVSRPEHSRSVSFSFSCVSSIFFTLVRFRLSFLASSRSTVSIYSNNMVSANFDLTLPRYKYSQPILFVITTTVGNWQSPQFLSLHFVFTLYCEL